MKFVGFPINKAKKIKLLIMDVDGVLTDGKIIIGSSGEEFKNFHVLDGTGIHSWVRAGFKTAIISGRKSATTNIRARELGISDVFVNMNKKSAYEIIRSKYGLKDCHIAYIGDDIHDLEPMKKAGLSASVSNGVEEVTKAADYVTERSGGQGAVREVIDLLLKSKNKKLKPAISRPAVFFFLCCLMVSCSRKKIEVPAALPSLTHNSASEKTRDSKFRHTITQGGKVVMEVESDTAAGFNTGTITLEKPVVKWYSDKWMLIIKGNAGRLEKKTGDVHFEEEVSAQSVKWGRIECNRLDWNKNKGRIKAEGKVRGEFYLDSYVEGSQ